MTKEFRPASAKRRFGDFAPALVRYSDEIIYGEVWKRPELGVRERSLITIASLVTAGNWDQLEWHFQFAIENGATVEEIVETITHLAFYAEWPKAISAMSVAKQLFERAS
jgi:4-carboxymuconolactone decarboxylase